MNNVQRFFVNGVFAVSFFAGFPVSATEQLDLSVMLKTLPLLTNPPASPVAIAVVFDPANAASRSDAEGVKAVLESGIRAPGDLVLVPQLISVTDLSALSKNRIVIIAQGVPETAFPSIHALTVPASALTISTDLACVKSNKCVLGIVSKPRVQVFYSALAAEESKISFASSFTMLVKQVGSM